MTDTKYWLWLSLALGSVSKRITAVLEHFDGPEEIYSCHDKSRFEAIDGLDEDCISNLMDKSANKVDEVWEICKNKGIRILTYSSPMYPENLANIYDPPYVLYVRCKEKINLNSFLKIAMVGNRHATEYGEAAATQLAYDLSLCGALVVSGMAEGIDGAAHKGALSAGAFTVAVLGCGVDVCYPSFHQKLYEDIIEHGMIISEFPPGTPPLAHNFPIRNRIISGLSEAVIVVESPLSGGSLITADSALEQGRDVYAVPGNINMPHSVGTNNLIKQGAKIITEAADIIKEYEGIYENVSIEPGRPAVQPKSEKAIEKEPENAPAEKERNENKTETLLSANVPEYKDEPTDFTKNVTSSEQLILDNLMLSPVHIDRLCELTGLAANIVSSNLTLLEMRGLVNSHPGKNFSLKV